MAVDANVGLLEELEDPTLTGFEKQFKVVEMAKNSSRCDASLLGYVVAGRLDVAFVY